MNEREREVLHTYAERLGIHEALASLPFLILAYDVLYTEKCQMSPLSCIDEPPANININTVFVHIR